MRRKFLFMISILFTLACMAVNTLTPAPVNTPTQLSVIIPYPNQTARPAPVETPTPKRIISAPAFFPPWVAEFSDPILKTIQYQSPTFEDDFSPRRFYYHDRPPTKSIPTATLAGDPTATPTRRSKVDTKSDPDYFLLNKGWFFSVPDSKKNPFYARIDGGALILKLPEGKENKDMWVYSPRILSKNFVLQFDLEFGETQPENAFRFKFEQAGGERFTLDLVKNKTWLFRWGAGGSEQSRAGVYEYYELPQVRVTIIAHDTTCAVYLNNVPLDYFENCRADADQKVTPQSATFHILAEPGHSAVMTIDNVKMWDLDKIP